MGSRLGPNYACLFMGHIEEQLFDQYTGTKAALYKRYIDDIARATSGTREEIEDFATYVKGFHPSVNFTSVIPDVQLPFFDLCLKPTSDRLLTSIHYKGNPHSFLPELHIISPCPSSCRSTLCIARTRLYRYVGVCDPLWLPRYPK